MRAAEIMALPAKVLINSHSISFQELGPSRDSKDDGSRAWIVGKVKAQTLIIRMGPSN